MKCNKFFYLLIQGLTITSTLSILGFVIGAVSDHVTNKVFDTVLETGGICAAGFGAAGLLITSGIFALSCSNNNEDDRIINTYGSIDFKDELITNEVKI